MKLPLKNNKILILKTKLDGIESFSGCATGPDGVMRVPAGSPEGGEFCGDGGGFTESVSERRERLKKAAGDLGIEIERGYGKSWIVRNPSGDDFELNGYDELEKYINKKSHGSSQSQFELPEDVKEDMARLGERANKELRKLYPDLSNFKVTYDDITAKFIVTGFTDDPFATPDIVADGDTIDDIKEYLDKEKVGAFRRMMGRHNDRLEKLFGGDSNLFLLGREKEDGDHEFELINIRDKSTVMKFNNESEFNNYMSELENEKAKADDKFKAKVLKEFRSRVSKVHGDPSLGFPNPSNKKFAERLGDVIKVMDSNIESWASDHNMTPALYHARAREEIKNILDNADIYSRTTLDGIHGILDAGRFKSQFETGTSEGALDPGMRTRCENDIMGIDENIDYRNRPIYGYYSKPDFGGVGHRSEYTVASYGEVVVRMKPHVKHRAGWHVGDTLHYWDMGRYDNSAKFAASQASAPEIFSSDRLDPLQIVKACRRVDGSVDYSEAISMMNQQKSYVESLMYGGVSLDDVEEIAIHESTAKSDEGRAIIDKIKSRGLKYRIIDSNGNAVDPKPEKSVAKKLEPVKDDDPFFLSEDEMDSI